MSAVIEFYDGLVYVLQTLNKALKGPGGIIVLMTDGDENDDCQKPGSSGNWDLTDLFTPVEEARVIVVTMAFGLGAVHSEKLTEG